MGDLGFDGRRSVVSALNKRLGMTPDLWWMTTAQGLWGLGFGLYGLLFPLYIEKLGGGPIIIGLLTTLAGIMTAFVVFPGGWLADRVDRRTILLWGWVVAIPVPFMFAAAPRWEFLIPGVILYFGSAFSTPAMQAVIVEEAPPEMLSTAYNVVMSVFGAGMVAGPALGGYLTSHYSYSLTSPNSRRRRRSWRIAWIIAMPCSDSLSLAFKSARRWRDTRNTGLETFWYTHMTSPITGKIKRQ